MPGASTQHGATIHHLCLDCGGEYTSNSLMTFLQEQGTERHLTTHDTLQHNCIAELLNQHLLKRVQALLHHSGLPKTLWGEAFHHAVWLKNRTSTCALGIITPYEWLHRHKPNLGGVLEWGQQVWVHNSKGTKLDAHGVVGHWVGYNRDSPHAHRIYWLKKHSLSMCHQPTPAAPHRQPQLSQAHHSQQ